MNKRLSSLLAVAGLVSAAPVFAVPVLVPIDDFSVAQASITDSTVNGVAVTSSNAVRTMSVNLLSNPIASSTNTTEVIGGILNIANGVLSDTEVIIGWNIAAGLIPLGATGVAFFFDVVASDGNPTAIDFLLGSSSIASFVIPPNTIGSTLNFSTSAAALNPGGVLSMKINGAPGWDMALDAIGISYTPAVVTTVPEPATLALLGMGLLGMGVGMRKRKAA